MAQNFFPGLVKRKRLEDEEEVILHVDVRYADGIDQDNVGVKGNPRTYQVFGWVRPDKQFKTQEVLGDPDPVWRLICRLPIRRPAACKYLHLEVVRTRSRSDPGPSSGNVLVGRTRIPLPKEVYTREGGRFGLRRPVGAGFIAEGHLTIAMEMSRVENDDNY